MKRLTVAWLSAFLLSGSALTSYAQTNSPIPERDSSSVSLFEYATKIPKRNKVFNLDLEMHAGFNADFFSGKLDEAAFRFRDVKIDVTGEVNDRLFYWYRQTLNGGYEGQALENLNESIEYAYIGYKLNERFTLTAGKQDVFYGGFEYDENPLLIYEYSDMNEYSLCYLTGIGLGYQPNESQEIRLQVTNSRMGSMEDEYGRLPEGFKKPRVPLFYTLNWNGNFLDELIHLRYSVSAAEQAQGKYMYSVYRSKYRGRTGLCLFRCHVFTRKIRPIRIIDRIDPARSLRRGGTGTTGSYAKHRLSFAGGGNTVSFPSQMATIRERNV